MICPSTILLRTHKASWYYSDGTGFRNRARPCKKNTHAAEKLASGSQRNKYPKFMSSALSGAVIARSRSFFGREELFPDCGLVYRHIQGGFLSCVLQLLDEMLLLSLEAHSQLHSYSSTFGCTSTGHGRGVTADVGRIIPMSSTPE